MMQNNDWSLRHETVLKPVLLPELTQEQSVELDYVLPDYYPDFFRLLYCTAEASVISQSISEGILQYALHVQLHVLYCGEQTETIQALTQQLDYHGQFTLPPEHAAAGDLQIRLTAEPSYLNCRAVSQRRIDLRGAVRVRAALCGEEPVEILSSAEGLHTQTQAVPVSYVSEILRTEKHFTLAEDIRLDAAQPAMLSLLRAQTSLSVSETRIVAGKLVIKGEAAVTLLYTSAAGAETLSAVLPFSQIAEQDGLSDDMPCTVTALLSAQNFTPESEQDGDIRLLHCDLQISLQCTAIRQASGTFLTDLYSTVHPAELQREMIPVLTAPVPVTERMQQKLMLTQPEAVLTKVYAAWAEPVNLQRSDCPDGGAMLSGSVHVCVLAADAENHPLMLEQQEPFTWELPHLHPASLLPPVQIQSCTYTLTGSDSVSVQAELLLSGQIMQQQTQTLLTDVQIDPEAQLSVADHAALRLYFAQPSESLWEIAKRYHTSEAAIREENDIPAEQLTDPQMLLIPIVR